MKKYFALALLAVVVGCVGCTFSTEDVKSFVSDPHYVAYQNKLDVLEKSYLAKEIPYAKYLEKKKLLDEQYAREIQKRTELITK